MQGTKATSDPETNLAQIYHEAPNDVFEYILSKCSDLGSRRGSMGGLNALMLANKRCKQVAESCTTRLTRPRPGPEHCVTVSLPIALDQRCWRIEEIRCDSENLRSLVECPDVLRRLYIEYTDLSDLSPPASCSSLKVMWMQDTSVSDIAVVASMPHLEVFVCLKYGQGRPSIKNISPLASCPILEVINLAGNKELKDLSPLSACTALENLYISLCPLITSLTTLASLKKLKKLKKLNCRRIDPQTSLFSFLVELSCEKDAVDLEELRRRRPLLRFVQVTRIYQNCISCLK